MYYGYTRWHFVGIVPKPDLQGAAATAVGTFHEALRLLLLHSSPAESW
jgi:hypothetical protein